MSFDDDNDYPYSVKLGANCSVNWD